MLSFCGFYSILLYKHATGTCHGQIPENLPSPNELLCMTSPCNRIRQHFLSRKFRRAAAPLASSSSCHSSRVPADTLLRQTHGEGLPVVAVHVKAQSSSPVYDCRHYNCQRPFNQSGMASPVAPQGGRGRERRLACGTEAGRYSKAVVMYS